MIMEHLYHSYSKYIPFAFQVAGGISPWALTEPYVNLSIHKA